ncbi:uncharacterized [Tachysurus ichikawai]
MGQPGLIAAAEPNRQGHLRYGKVEKKQSLFSLSLNTLSLALRLKAVGNLWFAPHPPPPALVTCLTCSTGLDHTLPPLIPALLLFYTRN